MTAPKRKGLLQILAEHTEAMNSLAREENATRQVMRYWMTQMAEKPIIVDMSKLAEEIIKIRDEIEIAKKVALALRK